MHCIKKNCCNLFRRWPLWEHPFTGLFAWALSLNVIYMHKTAVNHFWKGHTNNCLLIKVECHWSWLNVCDDGLIQRLNFDKVHKKSIQSLCLSWSHLTSWYILCFSYYEYQIMWTCNIFVNIWKHHYCMMNAHRYMSTCWILPNKTC